MTENERINNLISYLISSKKIRNQQQFVEEIDSDKSTVSQIKSGKIGISKKMLVKIKKAYPFISDNWLINGEGEMLKSKPYSFEDKTKSYTFEDYTNMAYESITEYQTQNKEEYWRNKYIAILEENQRLYKELSELKRFIL
jgi:plasmid maintenance system antidote protein VapI